MGHPVMDKKRDTRVVDEVQSLFGSWVGGHNDHRARVKGSRWEVSIIHERNVRMECIACREM